MTAGAVGKADSCQETWPRLSRPHGQGPAGLAAARLCSLTQRPPCPPQSPWRPLGDTPPGFAHAPPGSFPLTLQVLPGNVTSPGEPSLLSSIQVGASPPPGPLPSHLLLCTGWKAVIARCHRPHYLLGPRPMSGSPLDRELHGARIGVRLFTPECPETQRSARHTAGVQ